mmetsp:Transcript_2245/g.2584  ORF Transcript_2245/g.2584 Transcript_2245/m.2584 type:complete len:234 (+) Transcript_2245:600-1301(+)
MNLFQLLFKLPVFTWLCAHLEKSFRTMWTAKYLFVVSATSAFVSSIIKVFLYVGSTDEKYLFHDMYGLGGILVTLFLGNILAEPNGRFYKNFEYRVVLLPYVIATFLLSLAGFQVNDVLLVISSLVVSLVYLRYNKPANLVINSEEIKLDVLFPAGVRPYILARFKCTLFGASLPVSGSQESHLPTTLPKVIVSDPVGERRRARALQALDRKLAEISREPEVSLDDDEDIPNP